MSDPTTTTAEPTSASANQDESITLDIGSHAGEAAEVRSTGTVRGKVDRRGVATGTGRRKTSVARVRIQAGSGKLTVNERQLEEFFPVERDRQMILAPLQAADALKNV